MANWEQKCIASLFFIPFCPVVHDATVASYQGAFLACLYSSIAFKLGQSLVATAVMYVSVFLCSFWHTKVQAAMNPQPFRPTGNSQLCCVWSTPKISSMPFPRQAIPQVSSPFHSSVHMFTHVLSSVPLHHKCRTWLTPYSGSLQDKCNSFRE